MKNIAINWLERMLTVWDKYFIRVVETLITDPTEFQGGQIWNLIENIFNGLTYLGSALLIVAFFFGIIRTYTSTEDFKRPETYVRLLFRVALAELILQNALPLVKGTMTMVTKWISNVYIIGMTTEGVAEVLTLPEEVINAVRSMGFFQAFGIWALALIGWLVITVMSIYMLIMVYGRFFKIYVLAALAPIPLAGFGGEPTTSIAVQYCKSFFGTLLEGLVMVISGLIFRIWTTDLPTTTLQGGTWTVTEHTVTENTNGIIVDSILGPLDDVWSFVKGIGTFIQTGEWTYYAVDEPFAFLMEWCVEIIIAMLVFIGIVKMADNIIHQIGF